MSVLVTGGAGYIGGHTCLELLESGYDIVVMDNFYNSKPRAVQIIKELAGRDFPFYRCDMLDRDGLNKIFSEHEIHSVIHFAGLKAVGESVSIPLKYYHNNITGTLTLLEAMTKFGVNSLVFSSSATVYGEKNPVPYSEDMETGGCTNPYGQTKCMIEQILRDLYTSDNRWHISSLRYFNPIGAHESGRIGEDPNDIPNNLMPYITQVAVGKLSKLQVFGNDYDTPDGTGVRDYIHVSDLARGHLLALEKLKSHAGYFVYNLGTGKGHSVLDVIQAFEKASGKKINYEITGRRKGDIGACYADVTKAKAELGFTAEYDIDRMCADSWRWQANNPNGL